MIAREVIAANRRAVGRHPVNVVAVRGRPGGNKIGVFDDPFWIVKPNAVSDQT